MGGGVGKAISGIARLGQQAGDNHSVLLLDEPRRFNHIERCKAAGVSVLGHTDSDSAIDKADAVIVSYFDGYAVGRVNDLIRGFPQDRRLLLWYHNNGVVGPKMPDDIRDRADHIMVTTPATLELPEFRSKSTLVCGFGDFDPTEIEPKTDYSLHSGGFVIGYVGSPTYKKLPYDFLDYVDAAVKLIPDARFVMVGESDRKIVHPNVTFKGWVDDVYRAMLEFDVFGYLLQSDSTATTENAVLEAMAVGLPIVLSREPAGKWLVEHEVNGMLIKSASEYAKALFSLRQSEQSRARYGNNARKRSLDFDKVANFCSYQSALSAGSRIKAFVAPFVDTKRHNLREVIPLSAPYYIGIEPTRQCNFKCFFCQHSTRGEISDKFQAKSQQIKHLNWSLFEKIVDDIFNFPEIPKRISLMGMGEPTLNPELPAMIRYIRNRGFNGRLTSYTNGSTLTEKFCGELSTSGLSTLQISVYGLSSSDYERLAGVAFAFDSFVAKVKYLYKNKGTLQVRIKTTDDVAYDESTRKFFFSTFGDICDQIVIEHIINIPVQMGEPLTHIDRTITQFGIPVKEYRQICPWMLYQTHVNVDGDVFCCDILAKPREQAIGNIATESLSEIWTGLKRTRLLYQSLEHGHHSIEQCRECDDIYSIEQPEEYLDDCRTELLVRLKEKRYLEERR
ncbi:MAG: glycosyltransferase [Synergistaceae bacterium]|nr:glycosyltransferase [Synergistaceae bacterium]